MKERNKQFRTWVVIALLLCAAIPQLLIYYKGYYYETDASPMLKYPVNIGCFLGVMLLGNWYLKLASVPFLAIIWCSVYTLGLIFIISEYGYHYLSPRWGAQTWLNMMSVFEILVSPLPFLIAWLLVRMTNYYN